MMADNKIIPYTIAADQLMNQMQSGPAGLTQDKVETRLRTYGKNELNPQKKTPLPILFIRQFKNSIVLLLFVAAVISALFQDYTEAVAILAVIIINAIIGFILEAQAINSMEALKKMDKLTVVVVRENKPLEIDARNLVPGDIMVLESGNLVAADARIIESPHLETNESVLTGESVPVIKDPDEILAENTILADRVNMVFKGTSITKGNAKAIVTSTGLSTEMGLISEMVEQAQKDEIPLNKKLNVFSKKLIWLTIIIIIPFFVIELLRGNDTHLILETAIALAVAAIPEGLPIVATISLAKGMLRLANSNVIVKKLAAVETLGETDIIITDKTGTLTENQLKVEKTDLASGQSAGTLDLVAVLCNNASLSEGGESIGDPVEIALLKYVADKDNQLILKTLNQWKEINEKPFDSTTRYMANLYVSDEGHLVTAKGSPAEILELCPNIESPNGSVPLTGQILDQWHKKTHDLSAEGLKVLGFAYKRLPSATENYATDLTFLGLVGFMDPPRPEVSNSIAACHEAGIKVVMATGDHPETARSIAHQIGLVAPGKETNVLHGKDLLSKDLSASPDLIEATQIFSRVTPEQKLNLIDFYQKKGFVVGMTGDGVNDAPALKKADIGIAMGKRGTQVAEEASDMVLQDDSFSSIVEAIKQGRTIFRNIKNFIIYLLSCNLTEIMVVAIAAFSNLSLPLLPLQILFLNLVTDVFPALALGMGEGNPLIMKARSKDPDEAILSKKNWISIVTYSSVMTICILAVFYYGSVHLKYDEVTSNNIAFFTLAFAQLWHPFNLIGRQDNILKNEIVSNLHLWMAILFCAGLLIATYLVPFMQEILQISHLSSINWTFILGASIAPLLIIRIMKKINLIQ
tara:strand:+ start:21526 stop:24123 length:2598 start_codon:yes stop_codon:yes gene_type:complete